MSVPKVPARILAIILVILVPFLSTAFGLTGFTAVTGPETSVIFGKTGGFMTGVCHPKPEYQTILDANIGWIRDDLPFPFDKNGEPSRVYLYHKAQLQEYAKSGIRVLAITPYPHDYIENGLDIRNEEDIRKIQDVARFYVNDLRDCVGAFQVTNEMGVDRFTKPYTIKEAAKFIGVQLQAMYPIRGNILIGYNFGGPGLYKLPFRMLRYNAFCDFVGLDLYFGCFENVIKTIGMFPAIMRTYHLVTRKPILLTEFGYIGYGEPKTAEEKAAILEKFGVHSEEEAAADINSFIEKLPETLQKDIERSCAGMTDKEKAKALFQGEYANHIYCELPKGFELIGYAHTPDGQAKFYADLIPRLRSLRFCIGAFIYMWHDSEQCYVCGQPDCPVETGWGLIDGNGMPKPAYYAVQQAFAKEPAFAARAAIL